MIGWSGRRNALTILLFIGPTLLGVLLLNIVPILLSTYTSFTNRNRFHPNPDCNVFLTSILDPVCWPMFRAHAPRGLAEPYSLAQPLWQNYSDLVGQLFTWQALGALAMIMLCFAPLVVAGVLDRRMERDFKRSVSSSVLWAGAIVIGLVLAYALNIGEAYNTLMSTGDFFVVVFRTLLFV